MSGSVVISRNQASQVAMTKTSSSLLGTSKNVGGLGLWKIQKRQRTWNLKAITRLRGESSHPARTVPSGRFYTCKAMEDATRPRLCGIRVSKWAGQRGIRDSKREIGAGQSLEDKGHGEFMARL